MNGRNVIRVPHKLSIRFIGHLSLAHKEGIHFHCVGGPFLRRSVVATHLKFTTRNLNHFYLAEIASGWPIRSSLAFVSIRRSLNDWPRSKQKVATHSDARKHNHHQPNRDK